MPFRVGFELVEFELEQKVMDHVYSNFLFETFQCMFFVTNNRHFYEGFVVEMENR